MRIFDKICIVDIMSASTYDTVEGKKQVARDLRDLQMFFEESDGLLGNEKAVVAILAVVYLYKEIYKNAIDAHDSNTSIGYMTVSHMILKGQCIVTINDDGKGFPKTWFRDGERKLDYGTVYARAFAEGSEKKGASGKLGGSFLGLMQLNALLARFDGRLEVANSQSGGAVFTIVTSNALISKKEIDAALDEVRANCTSNFNLVKTVYSGQLPPSALLQRRHRPPLVLSLAEPTSLQGFSAPVSVFFTPSGSVSPLKIVGKCYFQNISYIADWLAGFFKRR